MSSPREDFRIGDVFGNVELPANLRTHSRLVRGRPVRWLKQRYESLCARALLSPLLDSRGHFDYRRNGEVRRIQFNARNAQFHAIYDPSYRYGYEFETGLLLARLCRDSTVFYDVGANWGYFSLLVAATPGFNGQCHSFEPNPPTFRDLVSTIQQAGLAEIVRAWNCGLGAEPGSLRIDQSDPFLTGVARLSAAGSGPTVPVRTLDSLDAAPPDIVKIDAEGMEVSILRGATRVLREQKPALILENFLNYLAPRATIEPLELLHTHGYRVFSPMLDLRRDGVRVLAGYGAAVGELLETDPDPSLCLVPVTPDNRFLLPWQLNLFACHRDRLDEIVSDKITLATAAP